MQIPGLVARLFIGIQVFETSILIFFCPDTISLPHRAYYSCGIPDGETIILIGGAHHTYVTRCNHDRKIAPVHVILLTLKQMTGMI